MEHTLWGLTKTEWDMYAVLGTLLSAMSSLLAVFVALYLANRTSKHTATVKVAPLILMPAGSEGASERFIQISIVNSGERPIRIEQLGWRAGVLRKSFVVQTFDRTNSSNIPIDLSHGQSASWMIPAEHRDGTWEDDIAEKLLHDSGPFALLSFRVFVYTSVGKTFSCRPKGLIIERLEAALTAYKKQISE